MTTNPHILTVCGAGLCFFWAAEPAMAQQQQPYRAAPPPQYAAPQYAAPQYQTPQYQTPQGYATQPVYPGQYPPNYSQPAAPQTEYVSPIEFLPTFGRKFGDMFRRLFYGDSAQNGYAQPQGYSGGYPPQGQRSLDQPPGYYPPQGQRPSSTYPQASAQPQAPRYERPPTPGTPATTRAPQAAAPKSKSTVTATKPASSSASKSSTTAANAKKYTPPTLSSSPARINATTPPPAPQPESKTETANATRTEHFPLPGSQPRDSTEASSTKPKTEVGGISGGTFLKGKRTGKEGRVTSPYPPYQELDITGLGSGSLALDPTTNKVFEVP